MQKGWDEKLVKAHLIQAFVVLYDTTGRVGPGKVNTYWPDYTLNPVEKADQLLAGTNSIGRMRARIPRSVREIGRMENALIGFRDPRGDEHRGWLSAFLESHQGARTCLGIYVTKTAEAEIRNRPFKQKGFCNHIGLAYSTYRRRRDDGAQIIAGKLDLLGVSPW